MQKAEARPRRRRGRDLAKDSPELTKVSTPGKKSVAEVAGFLKLPEQKFIKTLVYRTDENELVAALVRGDHEINEIKLQAVLGCREVTLADETEVRTATGVTAGFLGPIGLKLRTFADLSIQGMEEAVTGANEDNAHFIQVDQERDFTPTAFADLRFAVAGDPCPRCEQGSLETYRGIEVGQVFYLGKKYSEALGATYLDAEGRERPIEMGCYGIGISRLMAAAIEQNHDANGIMWPFSIAPMHVLLLPINYKDKAVKEVCDNLYQELRRHSREVLLDDRDERPGVKFKDADLIGVPLRVTVGTKGLDKGVVELRWRRDGKTEEISAGDAARKIQDILGQALQE